jgi:hypothetical protein
VAGEAITLENLRQLLSIQTGLREQAETRWQSAQRALVGLLEACAPEEVDRRLKDGQPVDSLPVDELEELLRRCLAERLRLASLSNGTPGASAAQQQARLAKQEQQLQQAQEENARLQARLEALQREREALQARLAALEQVHAARPVDPALAPRLDQPPLAPPGEGSAPVPGWMAAWRVTETFERDAGILAMLGETGLARRPLIEARAAELLGIKKAGGSIQALLARLAELGLVESNRPWEAEGAGSGGRLPDLLRLTERGELAYWLLSNRRAAANEFDRLLPLHVSPEHTLLNLQAADMLREAGYQVDVSPPEITLPDGGLFRPDLVIRASDGVTHFVEVERETHKNLEARQAKWRNFYQASGGRLYVVCDNRSCMRAVRSEINYCLGNRPLVVSLTNLADLQTGKRGEGDSVWLESRSRG